MTKKQPTAVDIITVVALPMSIYAQALGMKWEAILALALVIIPLLRTPINKIGYFEVVIMCILTLFACVYAKATSIIFFDATRSVYYVYFVLAALGFELFYFLIFDILFSASSAKDNGTPWRKGIFYSGMFYFVLTCFLFSFASMIIIIDRNSDIFAIIFTTSSVVAWFLLGSFLSNVQPLISWIGDKRDGFYSLTKLTNVGR